MPKYGFLLSCIGAVKVVIHKEPARRGSGPCSVVQWSQIGDQMHLFAGFATGKVASFLLSDGTMRKISAVSVGVAVSCYWYTRSATRVVSYNHYVCSFDFRCNV